MITFGIVLSLLVTSVAYGKMKYIARTTDTLAYWGGGYIFGVTSAIIIMYLVAAR